MSPIIFQINVILVSAGVSNRALSGFFQTSVCLYVRRCFFIFISPIFFGYYFDFIFVLISFSTFVDFITSYQDSMNDFDNGSDSEMSPDHLSQNIPLLFPKHPDLMVCVCFFFFRFVSSFRFCFYF